MQRNRTLRKNQKEMTEIKNLVRAMKKAFKVVIGQLDMTKEESMRLKIGQWILPKLKHKKKKRIIIPNNKKQQNKTSKICEAVSFLLLFFKF